MCLCIQVFDPPSRRSARLSSLQDNEGAPATSTADAPIPPLPDPSSPHENAHAVYSEDFSIYNSDPLVFSESQLQTTQHSLHAYSVSGRHSSIDGDSSEDLQEESSIDGEELDELLRWPPEMRIAPQTRKRMRCRRATAAADEDEEGRDNVMRGGEEGWSGRESGGGSGWESGLGAAGHSTASVNDTVGEGAGWASQPAVGGTVRGGGASPNVSPVRLGPGSAS